MNEDRLYNKLAKGILTDEEIDNLVDEIMNIPVEKNNNNCLSSYGSINVDDLINAVKEFKKVPTYDELLKENQQLKEKLKQNFNTDYTSIYIYCEEQVKDKIKVLEQENKQLKKQQKNL